MSLGELRRIAHQEEEVAEDADASITKAPVTSGESAE